MHIYQIGAKKELKRHFSSLFLLVFTEKILSKGKKIFSAKEKIPHGDVENYCEKSTRCCTKGKIFPQNTNLCGMCGKAPLVNMHNFAAFFYWKEIEFMQFSGSDI